MIDVLNDASIHEWNFSDTAESLPMHTIGIGMDRSLAKITLNVMIEWIFRVEFSPRFPTPRWRLTDRKRRNLDFMFLNNLSYHLGDVNMDVFTCDEPLLHQR